MKLVLPYLPALKSDTRMERYIIKELRIDEGEGEVWHP